MVELDPARLLDRLVDLNVNPGFDEKFKEHLEEGEPILVFPHQSHADGVLAAIVAEHLLNSAKSIKRIPELKGFVMPVAKSLFDGQQSRILYIFFHTFNCLMSMKGLNTLPYTREKDVVQYGMNRGNNLREVRTIEKRLKKGYRLAVFPEGSVQGGRHPQGGDPEDIYGMREVVGNELINAYRSTKIADKHRPAFFVAVGLHGGFRLLNPNREGLGPTKAGLATFLGIPERWVPHVKAEATLGAIIPEESIAARFGKDWVKVGGDAELVEGVNRFIMEQVASLVPARAQGIYAPKRAIELLG